VNAFPPRANAFWFGPTERRTFGWYHATHAAPRAMGIVLCPPLGHELLCTHRAYRHLAERLAALGFPTMRFDYHGTGDSAGSDLEDDRVEAWLATIDDAIDVVRDGGAKHVALFGTRIGATLATVVASRRGDVHAMALVAPATTGAGYLRELRAMHAVRDRGERRPGFRGQRRGDEEAIGFVFRRETIEALGAMDLRHLTARPCERALVVPRDDLPGGEARVVDRLRALGTDVEIAPVSGYAAIAADDPYVAEVPEAMWNAVAQFFDAAKPNGASHATRSKAPPPSANARVHVEDNVVESTLWYGARERLFAVLSEPESGATGVAVVVSNTGANSRVGPNRFSVAVARRLARRGHAVLRIDLGGIGDSPAEDVSLENELFATRSIDDVRAAIDALSARGYRRFVAMGLCAGAYMSFHAGLADDRIAGIALMNPPAFEWRAGRKVERLSSMRVGAFRSTRYYRHRALRVDTWKRLARGEVDARGIASAIGTRLRDRATTEIKRSALFFGHGDWVMSDLAQKFAALAKRDARVLLVFNGAEPMLDEIDRHLGSMMTWLEKRGLALEIIDDTDHIFAPVWSQERAAGLLVDFVDDVARHGEERLVAR
jgi:pimeloyl-ACP methyl ester carboxylesterase